MHAWKKIDIGLEKIWGFFLMENDIGIKGLYNTELRILKTFCYLYSFNNLHKKTVTLKF